MDGRTFLLQYNGLEGPNTIVLDGDDVGQAVFHCTPEFAHRVGGVLADLLEEGINSREAHL